MCGVSSLALTSEVVSHKGDGVIGGVGEVLQHMVAGKLTCGLAPELPEWGTQQPIHLGK